MAESAAMLARCLRWLGPARPAKRRLDALVVAMRQAGLGPASINRHFCALRTKWPGLAVPWQREPRGRTRTIGLADLSRLTAALGGTWGPVAAWLAWTGMRVGEAWALLPGDVGAAEAVVRTSKNGEGRVVPLTQQATAAWAASPGSAGWARLSRSAFQHAFRAAVLELGLGDLRPHDLRHSCASRLVEAGVATPVVSAWLGHRDSRSTLRYVHVGSVGLSRAREMLESST